MEMERESKHNRFNYFICAMTSMLVFFFFLKKKPLFVVYRCTVEVRFFQWGILERPFFFPMVHVRIG